MPEDTSNQDKDILRPSMSKLFAVARGVEQFTPQELAWFDQNPERYERQEQLRAAVQGFIVDDNVPDLEGFAERIEKAARKKDPPSR